MTTDFRKLKAARGAYRFQPVTSAVTTPLLIATIRIVTLFAMLATLRNSAVSTSDMLAKVVNDDWTNSKLLITKLTVLSFQT